MKVALAQINTTVGHVEGNTARAVGAIEKAIKAGADSVVLPELTVSGYPPQDLAERSAFVRANESAVEQIAAAAADIYAVVGHLACADGPAGKQVANAVSVVRNGRVLERRDKSLLPTYDVFDEARHFRPAPRNEPCELGALTTGLTICEDAWNDPTFWERQLYEHDPVAELAGAGAELIVNVAASPFSVGRGSFRRSMLAAGARRHGLPMVMVNLVGGNDQLIFDGRSVALDCRGRTIAEAAAFEEDLLVVDTDAGGSDEPIEEPVAEAEVWQALNLGLADYARKCGFREAVLALSGGIDSSVTAALAASALGAENVTALFMPTEFSSERSRRDAREVAGRLGIDYHCLSVEELRLRAEGTLEPVFDGTERGVAEENIQARLRGLMVMAYANKFGCLPLAAGNKSELAVGYCTLYGDMVGGLAVIGDVPKTMVYQLARHINKAREVIPPSVLQKPPSAELKPDQQDRDVLPPYEVLDPILNRYIEQNQHLDEIAEAGFEPELVARVVKMVDRAEYKRRQAPITLRVTTKAFGRGRRLPVAQKWDPSPSQ